jgi:predicted GTPase
MKKNDIFENLADDINNANFSEENKSRLLKNIRKLKSEKINLLITGATGSGKSSTINALFDTEIAKVGVGVDPETMDIKKFELDNLILWDSPGLGDGRDKDIQHSKGIISKLNELDENGKPLIDMVLVILDGSSRDLGTSYELINSVIIPNIGENPEKRILIAINQADVAMKGKYWNEKENKPEKELEDFLNEKVASVKRRINEATGLNIEPIYYSAGYKDKYEKQNPYNLSKLLYLIVKYTPINKRLIYANNISSDEEMWKSNDEIKDYNKEIKKSLFESVKEGISEGAEIGGEIGKFFGKTGETIGKIAGGVIGGIASGIKSFFSW